MFCDECDCRRVVVRVFAVGSGLQEMANLSYGWGTRSFYVRWMGREDEEAISSAP